MRSERLIALAALPLLLAIAGCGDKSPSPEQMLAEGKDLYAMHCLACHQADGRGVPYFQPPLVGGEWVTGDVQTLAAFVISGGFDSASRTDSQNENVMPMFDYLKDADLARILTYVRDAFGNHAGPVSEADVAAGRKLANP